MRKQPFIFVLLAAVAIFHGTTVRQGHVWGDDYAMYVLHARNIVEGRAYSATGYIYNPSFGVYGPRLYPPVFPLLVAPIYKVSKLNLIPMKLEQVAFILLALVLVYALWKRDLGAGYALALVAVLGFAPAFWLAKDNILSDVPFLFFFYLTALLAQNAPHERTGGWHWSVLIGITMYLAIGTRIVGFALPAGLALNDLVRLRSITRRTLGAIAVCGALLATQRYFMGPGQGSYFDQLHPTWRTVAGNVADYTRVLASFWVGSIRNPFAYLIITIFALLAGIGLYLQWKRGFTVVEASLAPYLVIILLWPFAAGIRLAFPLVLWIGFLAFFGLKGVSGKLFPQPAAVAPWVLVLLVAVPFAQFYSATDFGPIRQTTGLPEFNQLCEAVRKHTADQETIIYFRARALALYTGRPASVYNYLGRDEELWSWVKQIQAKYFVTTIAFDEDKGFLSRFVQNYPSQLELVYANTHFRLYRIRSIPDGFR